jgi:serine/threonine protein kinase
MAPGESRYRILRTISDQGATEILEAVALGAGSFERRVVMKRARPEARSEDPEFVERFLDEARIASQLHHANVVSVLDFGVGEGGAPFLVMDFVDGLDVGALTKRGLAQGRPITPSIAVHVTREIAHGLAYAHAALDREGQPLGIVHRDIAPGNVLISWDGDVLLTDFGIARAHARATRTAVGRDQGHARLHGARADHWVGTSTCAPTCTGWARCCTGCSPGAAPRTAWTWRRVRGVSVSSTRPRLRRCSGWC